MITAAIIYFIIGLACTVTIAVHEISRFLVNRDQYATRGGLRPYWQIALIILVIICFWPWTVPAIILSKMGLI